MADDLNEQWRRLSEHYAQMYDGELVRLAGQYSGLTDVAKQVLRDTMLKRGLGDPTKPAEVQRDSGRLRFEGGVEIDGGETADAEDTRHTIEYTWKTELCECGTHEQLYQLCETLERAGIKYWWRDPERYGAPMSLAGYIILVAADQLEEARKVIAEPIPQEIIEDSQAEVPPYVAPTCPRCSDPDPILFEDTEANRWSCEVCGHQWTDAVETPKNV
jgi:hypothetical protein